MRTITQEELNKILEDHKLWLEDNSKGSRADLYNVDLSHTNLSNIDLSHANLIYANLRNADLYNANLSHTNLSYADLSHTYLLDANLRNADLRYANLSHVDLSTIKIFNTIGNSKEIKTIQTSKYIINYTKDRIQIGCENRSYDEWFSMSDEEISKLDIGALDWWKEWKLKLKVILDY